MIRTPVEHVVGREVDDGNAKGRRRFGDETGACPVHGIGDVRLRLGLVDTRIGSRIDDDIAAALFDGRANGGWTGEIERWTTNKSDAYPVCRTALSKGPRHLPCRPGHEETHHVQTK